MKVSLKNTFKKRKPNKKGLLCPVICELVVYGACKWNVQMFQILDLLSLVNGGMFLCSSQPGCGDCRNLIKSGMAEMADDGWEILPQVSHWQLGVMWLSLRSSKKALVLNGLFEVLTMKKLFTHNLCLFLLASLLVK